MSAGLSSDHTTSQTHSQFSAPAHHLDRKQQEEITRLAESPQGAGIVSDSSTTGRSGAGLGSSSAAGVGGVAHVLGGGTGSVTQSHTGQRGTYEMKQNELDGARTSLGGGTGLGHGTSSSEFGNTGATAGVGSGTRQAAGLGVGGNESGAPRHGGVYDGTSSSGVGHGLAGAGAGAGAGLGAASLAGGASQGKTGGASAVAAKHEEGRGGQLIDSEFSNTATPGTLEHKLQEELQRNAQKAGTQAAGFGVHAGEDRVGLSGAAPGAYSTTESGYGKIAGATTGAAVGGAGIAQGLAAHTGDSTVTPGNLAPGTGIGTGSGSGGNKLVNELEQRATQSQTHASGFGTHGTGL